MYLTKLAQRNGDDSNAVTYSDLAAVVQVWKEHDPAFNVLFLFILAFLYDISAVHKATKLRLY